MSYNLVWRKILSKYIK